MLQIAVQRRTATPFEEDLRDFIDKYSFWWDDASAEPPSPGALFTRSLQESNEAAADRLAGYLEEEFTNFPAGAGKQALCRERLFDALRRFGRECFAFPDRHFDIIFSPEYLEVTRAFARRAQAFDESIKPQSLAQALRNVWVMNWQQLFLGARPSLTHSVFAYSLLYPYTDNLLDLPGFSRAAKEEACSRLAYRLAGNQMNPANIHEASVFRLVGMIEEEYYRPFFPEVFQSLLAIHAGQVKSLDPQSRRCLLDEEALLRISVEKGGSSVLADGWLVAGKLDREDADFFFGLGVVLQLLDDLQDLAEDRAAGHCTLFTRAAEERNLDELTSRLAHFTRKVLISGVSLAGAKGLELRQLFLRNANILMMRAMAESACLFSPAYLYRMEQYSPVSFEYLRERRRAVGEKFAGIWPAVAKRRNLRSIFDLLG